LLDVDEFVEERGDVSRCGDRGGTR
jgi:hypothetical protein